LYAFAEKWEVHYATAQRDIRAFRKMGQVPKWSGGRSGGFGYDGADPLFYRNAGTVEGLQGEGR
jgi:hypothetical protein